MFFWKQCKLQFRGQKRVSWISCWVKINLLDLKINLERSKISKNIQKLHKIAKDIFQNVITICFFNFPYISISPLFQVFEYTQYISMYGYVIFWIWWKLRGQKKQHISKNSKVCQTDFSCSPKTCFWFFGRFFDNVQNLWPQNMKTL